MIDDLNWAFGHMAQVLKANLISIDITIIESKQYKDQRSLFNAIVNLQPNLIHFFWRGTLKELISHFGMFLKNNTYKHFLINTAITFSVPDHLYIDIAEEKIKSWYPVFNFADNYSVSSDKLFAIYSQQTYIPKPFAKLPDRLPEDLFTKLADKSFREIDIIRLAWVGNSQWGKGYCENDHKGLHSIVLPALKLLDKKQYPYEIEIIDSSKSKKPRQEVFELLRNSDILICSSINEGTPLPAIEAMALGCAIISTDVGIIPEVITEVQQPFIVERSPIALAKAIEKLISNKELLETCKKQNAIAVKTYYDKNTVAPWIDFFEKSVSKALHRREYKKEFLGKVALNQKNIWEKKERACYYIINKIRNYPKLTQKAKKIISTFPIARNTINNFINDNNYNEQLDEIFIKNMLSMQEKESSAKTIAIYYPGWKGVAASTRRLFASAIPIPFYSDKNPALYSDKDVSAYVDILLNSSLENLVVSGGDRIHLSIVREIKRRKPNLNIYNLWHSGISKFAEYNERSLFFQWVELYKQGVIKGIFAVKKDLSEWLNSQGIRSWWLMNYIEPHLKSGKLRTFSYEQSLQIGIFAASSDFNKNLPTQLSAATMVKDAHIVVPHNEIYQEFIKHLDLRERIKFIEGWPLNHNQFLELLAQMSLNLYVTFAEASPMIPLESMAMGVPCIVGPTVRYFDEFPILKELLVVSSSDEAATIAYHINKVKEARKELTTEIGNFACYYAKYAQQHNANMLSQAIAI